MNLPVKINQKTLNVFIFIIMAFILLYIFISNRNMGIGYIDRSRLYKNVSIASDARKMIEKERNKYNQEIARQKQEIARFSQVYKHNKGNEKIKREYSEKQAAHESYIRYVNKQLGQIDEKMMKPIHNKIKKEFKNFGRKYGYNIIFEVKSKTNMDNILYADSGSDLTSKLIKFVDKKFADADKKDAREKNKRLKDKREKKASQKNSRIKDAELKNIAPGGIGTKSADPKDADPKDTKPETADPKDADSKSTELKDNE